MRPGSGLMVPKEEEEEEEEEEAYRASSLRRHAYVV